jgi:hypothetical protein
MIQAIQPTLAHPRGRRLGLRQPFEVFLSGGALAVGLLFGATLGTAQAQSDRTVLRLLCEEDAAGATVELNGAPRGECPADGPLDLIVEPGTHNLRVRKAVGEDKEQLFSKVLRIAPGTLPRQEVLLNPPQLTAAAQGLLDEKQARERDEAERDRRQREELERPIEEALAAQDAKHGLFCFAIQETAQNEHWRIKSRVSAVWEGSATADKGRQGQLATLRSFIDAMHAEDADWFSWSQFGSSEPSWNRPVDEPFHGGMTTSIWGDRVLSFGRGIETQAVSQRCYTSAEQAHAARRWYRPERGEVATTSRLPAGVQVAPLPRAIEAGKLFCAATVRIGNEKVQLRSTVWEFTTSAMTDQLIFDWLVEFARAIHAAQPDRAPSAFIGKTDGSCDVKAQLGSKCVTKYNKQGRSDIQSEVLCLPDALSAQATRRSYRTAAERDKLKVLDSSWIPANTKPITSP